MESPPTSERNLSWIVPHALTVTLSFGMILYGFSVYVTDEAAGAVFSKSVLSLAFAGSVSISGLMALPIGHYADKHGVRLIVGGGTVMGSAGLALFAAAQEPWQVLAIWWILLGPATAMVYYEPAYIAINQRLPNSERAKALGLLTVIGGFAGIIFIPLTGWMVSRLEWRPALLVFAAVLLVVGGSTALFALPKSHYDPSPVDEDTGQKVSISAIIKERRFILYTVGMTIAFLATQGIIIHRVARFEESGFTLETVTLWAALASAISLPGRWLAPMLAARFGPIRVQAAITLIVAIGVLFMLNGGSYWQMTAHFAMFGLAFGGLFPVRAMVMAEWYSGPSYGRIMGAQWTITVLIGASGAAIVGIMRDATGSYDAAVMLIAGLLVVSVGTILASNHTNSV